MSNTYLGNISGVFAIILWSFFALLTSYSEGIPPFLMASAILGTTFLIYLAIWYKNKTNIIKIIQQSPRAYLIGVGGIAGYVALYYFALKTAPIIEANLINYLWPLLIVIFSTVILKQKLSPIEITGIILGFCGAVMVLSKDNGININLSELYIYLPALGAAIIWALYSTLTKVILFEKDFMGIIYGASALILYFIHLSFESSISINTGSFIPVILLGIATVSYSFWDFAMKNGDTIMLASISYLIPLFSTILLVLFNRGELSTNIIYGGLLILMGCLLSNISKISILKRTISIIDKEIWQASKN